MSGSSSKTQSPPHLHLHVGTTSATTTAAITTNGSNESSSHHSPRRIPKADGRNGSGSGSGQINAACAACKYQRRRCRRDCLLAPYFPADQKLRFLNAHRLFGVSNMTKTLKEVEPKYRPDAMRTLIYESEARAADPVGGCVGIIEELRRQMHDVEMELQFVKHQIAIYRQASATDGGISDPAAAAAMILPAAANPEAVAGQQGNMTAAVARICAAQQPSIPPAGDLRDDPAMSHQQQLYDYFCYNNGAAANANDDDGGMQQYGFADGTVKAESPVVALGDQLGQHCQIQASPFVDAFNVKKLQVLPPATIQYYHGPAVAGDVMRPRQKKLKLGAPFKFEHDDEHMEEQQATARAPCHLELGFSSFYNA